MASKKSVQPKRVVSDSHKAAMAAGRQASRAVNAYLTALEESRPKRGRRVSPDEMQKRLAAAREQAEVAVGAARLLALQTVEDLEAAIRSVASGATASLEDLEKDFVASAKTYAENKGISYATWRKVGVPAELLKRAGITK